MRIIDTHLHLIYPDKFSYPWLDNVPALKRQWDWPTYWAEAENLGIEGALHMEVDVPEQEIEDETRFVLGIDPHVVGAISNARPEYVDFPVHLERMAAEPRVRGIRRLLQSDPDDLSAGDVFRGNIRRLAARGLVFDICVQARQLPVAAALAAACPDTQFVLDHCGNPPIDSGDIAQWKTDLAALARLPNVAGKISGIVNHAPPGWTAETLQPVVEHMIASFGWDRVVWGSDRPVLTLNGTLTQWVAAAKAIVAGASVDEQSQLFHRNAERIYGLRSPAAKRYGFVLGLKPSAVADYRRIHAAVWPQVLEQIKCSNIRNYSIYLREPENLLFAYYEYTGINHDADMAAMAADPVTQDWWKVCMPMQQPLPTKTEAEWWAGMEEVFHID